MTHQSPQKGFFARLGSTLTRLWDSTSRYATEIDDEVQALSKRGTTPISSISDRDKVRISGVIRAVTYSPRNAPIRLIAVLYDGTATIELRWPGRRDIPGLSVGKHIEVEGTATSHRDHFIVINPTYRLLPAHFDEN